MGGELNPQGEGWYGLKRQQTVPHTLPLEILHLVRAVVGVRDPALSCEACQDWLPSYVDAEVGGLAVGQLYPLVKRHLDLCADCLEAYLEVLTLALVEEAGQLPKPGQFPAPDLSFLPPPDEEEGL